MILLLDNYDSFTYNIVQYFERLGTPITVHTNNSISIADIEKMQPKAIVLGPGPGTPNQAGITLNCIEYFTGKLPMLGVCLGHQAIAQVFGAKIIRAEHIMHGRTSSIYHDNKGVFSGLPLGTIMTRYHSLIVDKHSMPDSLDISAWTKLSPQSNNIASAQTHINKANNPLSIKNNAINEIMGIRHKTFAIEGVQFHPESILSNDGLQIFSNFLHLNHLLTQ